MFTTSSASDSGDTESETQSVVFRKIGSHSVKLTDQEEKIDRYIIKILFHTPRMYITPFSCNLRLLLHTPVC